MNNGTLKLKSEVLLLIRATLGWTR